MPGLFGIINLENEISASQQEEDKKIFSAMGNVLQHHEDYIVEQTNVTNPKLSIGRIGRRFHNSIKWPIDQIESEASPLTFVAGHFTKYELNSASLITASTLCQWHGFFSATVIYPKRKITLIISDRRGSHPIFYTKTSKRLLFAPEVKALLVDPSVKKEINLEGLSTFLAQGYLLSDQTLFKNIYRLRGGQFLEISNGVIKKDFYYKFLPGSLISKTNKLELENELGQIINKITKVHLGEPEKTMIFLSGGVDSRGILGSSLAAVNNKSSILNTISWGTLPVKDNSDVAIANQIARTVGTNHRFMYREIDNYRENFQRANYLVDGLSEMPAFHPHEYQIMVKLREDGFERVLRGDETFGWSYNANNRDEALSIARLRRLRDTKGISVAIKKDNLNIMYDASDTAIEKILNEAHELAPNQAKDYFYFSHRLQCFLQNASYYKQIELDQRNILLDESILDFLLKIPDCLRIDKLLYKNTIIRQYPELSQFPYAKYNNLENWTELLSTETPVRKYALEEFSDYSSGIWDYLDRISLFNLVEELSKKEKLSKSLLNSSKSYVKQGLQLIIPKLHYRIIGKRTARSEFKVSKDRIVMRGLVLKHWYETFISKTSI